MSLELFDGEQTLTISMNKCNPCIEIKWPTYDQYLFFTLFDGDVDKVIEALVKMKRNQQLATVIEELAKTNPIIKTLGVNYCVEIFDTPEWHDTFSLQITSTIKGKLDAITK